MTDFLKLAFILAIIAIVFGPRFLPKLADFLARQHHKLTGGQQRACKKHDKQSDSSGQPPPGERPE